MTRLQEAPGSGRREPLTRERILSSALAMIDRDGLDALSMRRLAAELDVSAMSLYNHVPNKDSLLEGVVEAVLQEIELESVRHEDWAEGLKQGFHSFRAALLAHPHALPLLHSKPVTSERAFLPIELSLATLRRGGFDPETAIQAHWALVGFTMGHVAFQLNNPLDDPSTHELEAMQRAALPRDTYPNVVECAPYMVGCDFDAAYAFGLEAILDGLRARVAGPRSV
jgi:TetR/AcrR family transcriptional regulator, tetracycline repressor protein